MTSPVFEKFKQALQAGEFDLHPSDVSTPKMLDAFQVALDIMSYAQKRLQDQEASIARQNKVTEELRADRLRLNVRVGELEAERERLIKKTQSPLGSVPEGALPGMSPKELLELKKGLKEPGWAILGDIKPLMSRLVTTVEELVIQVCEGKADKLKLQSFKDYVHKRLDEAKVPVDPDSSHRAEGCRIGGRLDWVFGKIEQAYDIHHKLRGIQRMMAKSHTLYTSKDGDAPDSIRDGNGDVILDLCKRCGRGERDLEEHWCGP